MSRMCECVGRSPSTGLRRPSSFWKKVPESEAWFGRGMGGGGGVGWGVGLCMFGCAQSQNGEKEFVA